MGAQLKIPDIHVEAGGTVRGTFTFQVRGDAFDRACIKLVGKESTRHKTSAKNQHVRGRINVHKQYMTILGGDKGKFKGQLPGGEYTFPF